MSVTKNFKKLIPLNLYTDDSTSLFQKWLDVLVYLSDISEDEALQELNDHVYNKMSETRIEYWEKILQLPQDLSLTLADRRIRIISYLAGTDGTALDIKNLVAQALGIDIADVIIRPRKDFFVSSNITTNYTYDILFGTTTVPSFDAGVLRTAIERTHPLHCILGAIIIASDWWEWDNALKPLDDSDFATNLYSISLNGSLQEDIEDITEPDGNTVQINDYFIDSMNILYGFYARQTVIAGLTLRIEGSNNIGIGGINYAYTSALSPTFTPPVSGTEVHLLYAYVDSTSALAFGIATSGFESCDPSSYEDLLSPDNTVITPIAEVTISSATTQITDNLIKNVFPQI